MNQIITPVDRRRRRLLMRAPLVLAPLFTLLAWTAGVGKGPASKSASTLTPSGLNMQIPRPQPAKPGWWSKMDFYQHAALDSQRYSTRANEERLRATSHADSTAAHLNEGLRRLQAVVHRPPPLLTPTPPLTPSPLPELSQLENVVHAKEMSVAPDPDLQQLNRMLDKIMLIQQPQALLHKDTAVTIAVPVDTAAGVEAETESEGILMTGATIALSLQSDLPVRGGLVPIHTLVYGTVTLDNERLHIRIRSIRSGGRIIPVALEAYDLDGQQGIYVPGNTSRDVSKESADQALGSLNLDTYDPSLGAQASTAGIQALKTLLSRKVKQVRVTVRAGYVVILK